MPRVLLMRNAGLGDCLMLTALIKTLHEREGKQVDVLTQHPRVFRHNPHVQHINPSPIQPGYERVVDLNWVVESANVDTRGLCTDHDYMNTPRMDLFYRAAGVVMPERPEVLYTPTEEVAGLPDEPFIAFFLNSTSSVRTYPIELAMEAIRLLSRQHRVVILGDIYRVWGVNYYTQAYAMLLERAQHDGCRLIDLTDKTTTAEALAVIGRSKMVVSPDSGPVHAAAAMGIKCVGLFGNIDPRLRISYYPTVTALYKALPCAFCGDRYFIIKDHCPSEVERAIRGRIGAKCMWAISPYEVLEAVEALLAKDCSC